MTDSARLLDQLARAFNERRWKHVRALAAQVLPQFPEHAGVHFAVGVASLESGDLTSALRHLDHAVARSPERADVVVQLARALSITRRSREAMGAADTVFALAPKDAAVMDTLGTVYTTLNAHVQAVAAHRLAVELSPTRVAFRYNLATALISVGDTEAAEQEIETCLATDPEFWRAHLTLAHLRRQSSDSNHVRRLQQLISENPIDTTAQICLHLALAKELDDLADYPRAFDHLSQGKAASRNGLDYVTEQDGLLFAALQRAFPLPLPLQNSATGDPTSEPIVVFGMPRSGTTLVERILSSHPDVYAAGELQNFGMALRRAWGGRGPIWLDPDIAEHTRQVDWRKVGETYVASTRPATGHTPRFVDKFPFNFLYAGFIANALPNAKMVCLRRDPMDTCLANFQQLFAEKLPYYNYSFDLLDTGRYYVLFDRLMTHWKQAFPGRILELEYASLVNSQEASSRQLLDFCGLPWNDACLHFENNLSPVATASALQVREPIYKNALNRWKNYRPQLEELQRLLVDAGIPAT
jgi:cytochrome c-type biogenesis protein CcmH/NrfG